MPHQPGEEQILDEYERLQALDEFKSLSTLQKKVVYGRLENPDLKPRELAKKIGIETPIISRLFASKKWDRIAEELADLEKKELMFMALKTMRDCLTSKSEQVRLTAATTILKDAGVIKAEVKTVKQDNKIMVVWQNGEQPPKEVQVTPPVIEGGKA